MVVGSWGSIVFEVRGSPDKVRTYDEYTRTAESRWGIHEVLNAKPRPQFGGPGQHEVSLVIRLSADLGVNPRAEMSRIFTAADNGETAPLIRKGIPESQGLWYIESAEETDKQVNGRGDVVFAEMTVVFKEYF